MEARISPMFLAYVFQQKTTTFRKSGENHAGPAHLSNVCWSRFPTSRFWTRSHGILDFLRSKTRVKSAAPGATRRGLRGVKSPKKHWFGLGKHNVFRTPFSTSTFSTFPMGLVDFFKVENRIQKWTPVKRVGNFFWRKVQKSMIFCLWNTMFSRRRFRHRLFWLGPMEYLTFWKSKTVLKRHDKPYCFWRSFLHFSRKSIDFSLCFTWFPERDLRKSIMATCLTPDQCFQKSKTVIKRHDKSYCFWSSFLHFSRKSML